MRDERVNVVFTRDGVRVEEERKAPLSNDTKTVIVDELDLKEFPIGNLTMEVTSITPVLSDDDKNALTELRFEVTRLERSSDSTEDESSSGFWSEVKSKIGIRREDDEITLSSERNAKSNLEEFVRFLLENNYLVEDDLPVESGWKRYLIHTEPVDKEGDSMTEPVEVTDGVYLETKYSRNAIREKIRQLGDEFGE